VPEGEAPGWQSLACCSAGRGRRGGAGDWDRGGTAHVGEEDHVVAVDHVDHVDPDQVEMDRVDHAADHAETDYVATDPAAWTHDAEVHDVVYQAGTAVDGSAAGGVGDSVTGVLEAWPLTSYWYRYPGWNYSSPLRIQVPRALPPSPSPTPTSAFSSRLSCGLFGSRPRRI
jgi:hypothetical protein